MKIAHVAQTAADRLRVRSALNRFRGLRRARRTWEHLGREDPLGAVLTVDRKKGNQWTVDEFFSTGIAEVARVLGRVDELVSNLARGDALDFGCGVGRVTRALAQHFDRVLGVDIAQSMIDHARALNAAYGNCSFRRNDPVGLPEYETATFDFVYSRLVLQHIRPALSRVYIRELIRVLKAGGVLVFQLSAHSTSNDDTGAAERAAFLSAPVVGGTAKRMLPRSLVTAWRRLKFVALPSRLTRPRVMEMHGMSREEVTGLIRSNGAHLLAIDDDHCNPPGYEYFVTK